MSLLSTRGVTIAGFVLVIVAILTLEVLGRRPGSRVPTIGQWLGYLMRPKIGRVLVLLGWWWLGWHYFAR